jgi:hypothetical protein
MADVFISYAREDRARAEQIAAALQRMGLEVFWDNEIPPGATWADYIETKLTQCKALVVLWSEHSTKSQWVREEARMARDRGLLIPAMLDATPAPFGFGEVQAADLSQWQGDPNNPEWRRFANAVAGAAGRAPSQAPPAQPVFHPPPSQAGPRVQPRADNRGDAGLGAHQALSALDPKTLAKKPWVWIAGAVALLVVLVGVITNAAPRHNQSDASTTETAVASPAEETSTGDDNPQQIILAQLQQLAGLLAQQGFQQMGAPASGGLQQGQSWNVPVDMTAGYEYRLAGVCDRDCSDLDLVLYDPNNQQVAQDTSNDDHPIVAVRPAVSGRYTIQVQMYRCAVAPCYYAVALYAKQ